MQQPKVDWTCLAFGYSFLSSWHNLSSRFTNLGRAFITWLRTWTVPCVSLDTLSSLQSISSSSVERTESGLGLAPSLVGDAHACLVVSRSASRGPWSKGILHYLLCLLISVLSLHLGFTLHTKILLLYLEYDRYGFFGISADTDILPIRYADISALQIIGRYTKNICR